MRKSVNEDPKLSISERKIPFFLIWRHILRGNKWTLGLVIFLMSVAFINLIFINALFNGIVQTSDSQIINTNAGNITMIPKTGQEFITDVSSVVKKIEETPGVLSASPRTSMPSTMLFKGVVGDIETFAINPEMERKTLTIHTKMVDGSYLSTSDTDKVILGAQVAGGGGVSTGDSVLPGAKVGDKIVLRTGDSQRQLTVKGIFRTKYFQTDRQAFITEGTLQALQPTAGDKATEILIRTHKKGDEAPIIKALDKDVGGGKFVSWKESAGMMSGVTNSFVTINALLTTVGFIIAAVVIFIIIYVDISNKRRQIGIIRAIGIKSNIVGSTYILQSTIYSVVGILFGTLLFFVVIIPYFKFHPFSIPLGDVTLHLDYVDYIWRSLTVVAVSIISGTIPAILATRKNILDEIAGR